MESLRFYSEIWIVDFEFTQPPGDRPTVICMVAQEFRSGRTIRLWEDKLAKMTRPPFPIGTETLVVAYYASAELTCFLSLDWDLPVRLLDLFVEFRCLTNGGPTIAGNGLLGAMAHFGLGSIDATEKTDMRELAQRGGPFTSTERSELLKYCESDVGALAKLIVAMLPTIDFPRALLRGRYMSAAARIETCGVPIDVHSLQRIRSGWGDLQSFLIRQIDRNCGVYDGSTFKQDRFANWLARNNIPWPRLGSGRLALDDGTFRQMARSYPVVAPLRELRHTLGELRLESLTVGSDGRNRCLLSAFRSKTGRNQPSNAKFIFGPSCWMRALIKPTPGRAVAYVDWSGQEYGIAAYLSGDARMIEDYESGDPYLAFGRRIGVVDREATKATHPKVRGQMKVALGLGAMYGAGTETVAMTTGQPEAVAREWLKLHRTTYPIFWRWSQAAVDHAMLHSCLHTVFGWPVCLTGKVSPQSLANFPMQANGAEMLRLACCLATERGIQVCAPVHDALLVEGPADSIHEVVSVTQDAMAEASQVVLDSFSLQTDAEVVVYPDRYMDARGQHMWNTVIDFLTKTDQPVGQHLSD